ncbi:MAG: FAD-dependent oxidoreductase [Christensenellales bacterium]|jgi:fumarate reductase flavoprotein subunit
MKRFVGLLLVVAMLFATACTATQPPVDATPAPSAPAAEATPKNTFTPGTYTKTARGMYSDVTVAVTVDENRILSVEVTEQNDTRRIAASAVKFLPERIVAAQSPAVDTVSGATITSMAILSAAKAALLEAGGDIDALSKPAENPDSDLPTESYDVVIVGAGGSGLAAAVEIGRTSDASVLVLEKAGYTGGSTALSGGLLYVTGTRMNKETGLVEFTPEELLKYFRQRTAEMTRRPDDMWINEDLVLRIGQTIAPTYNYYLDEGIDLPNPYVSVDWGNGRGLGGFIKSWTTESGASEVWGDWFTALAEKNGAEIRVESEVTKLIVNDGAVEGVYVESPEGNYTVNAKKVLLACGGYGNNIPLLAEKNPIPNIEKTVSYTAAGDTGDFYALVEGLDVAEAGYGQISSLGAGPGYGHHTSIGLMCLIGFNVWVNQNGERFANEKVFPPYHESLKIYDQPEGIAYGIAGSDFPYIDANTGRNAVEVLEEAVAMGITQKADTLEELAAKIGVDPAKMVATIEKYNADCDAGHGDTLFGQDASVMAPIKEGPFYATRVYNTTLGTIGSLKANANCQILTKSGEPVPNLYGAGEVIFGNVYIEEYYASGSGVTVAVYTGVIAGEEIVKELSN